MTPRALLLGVGSAAGVLAGRALDGLGLIPGVHESDAVRNAVLAPGWTVSGLVACLLLGDAVSRLVGRAPLLAGLALVGGQLAVLGAPEMLGRESHGAQAQRGEHWGSLAAAIGLQVLLALLSVTTALLVVSLLTPSLPQPFRSRPPDVRLAAPPYLVALKHRRSGGGGGRAPPGGCSYSPIHHP